VPPGVHAETDRCDKANTQSLTVVNDPLSRSGPDVRAQYALQMKIIAGMKQSWDGYHQVAALRAAVAARIPRQLCRPRWSRTAKTFDSTLALVGGDPEGGRGGGAASSEPVLARRRPS